MRFTGVYQSYDNWAHRFLPAEDKSRPLLARPSEFTEKHSYQLKGKEGKQCTFEYQLTSIFNNFDSIKITSDNIEFPS